MYRDTTNIPTTNCAVITSPTTITTYDPTAVSTYYYTGNTYYKSNQKTYSAVPAGTVCYSNSQISEIQSDFDFITPFYSIGSIVVFLAILFLAFTIFIRPFFRSKA